MKLQNKGPQRRLAFRWPLIIVALLVGHGTLIITAVFMAVGGTGRGVVPDYYAEALNFDAHKADLAASAELGWQLALTPGSFVDAQGQRLITATLHDRDGHPVEVDQVELRVTRLADGRRESVGLTSTDRPGGYQAVAALPVAGWYQADVVAEKSGARFVQRRELQLVGGQRLPLRVGAP